MKVLFHVLDGIGHQNACVGLAQALAKRGHEIVFLSNAMFKGAFEKLGFKEIELKCKEKDDLMKNGDNKKPAHPLAQMKEMLNKFRETGMLSNRPPIEKLKHFDVDKEDFMGHKMYEELKETHDQIQDILKREQPDLIIVDHFLIEPCIAYGKIPWAYSFSGNPLLVYQSDDLPPPFSGYPTNDRSEWEEFRKVFENTMCRSMGHLQNKIFKEYGYPEKEDKKFIMFSPYINIYGYPEELDYHDVVKRPDTIVHVEAFIRDSPEPFELPEEFKKKIKPGDKLVYVSMGSMGSIDVDLMKRITSVLGRSKHKFIVSKGPAHEEYELPENMWGQAFLPQMRVLPLVDMVITHGGNNTTTETFAFGKPMLVMPLFADQFDNAQRVTEKGFGYRMDAYGFKDDELLEMVDRILDDENMIKRAKQAAERLHAAKSKERACERLEQIVPEIKKKMLQQN